MDENEIANKQRELRHRPIVREALEVLARGLPDTLWYHALPHTEDVLDEVVRFGLIDQLSARELELLAIAAACHDVGFISSFASNEPIGAAFARALMEKSDCYSSVEVALVERMILDTALVPGEQGPRQVPSTPLSGYLLDADLSNLGRDDFLEKGELQRKELGQDVEIFRANTLALLSGHTWHTKAALSMRKEGKEKNVELLKGIIRAR
jgi:predicted metal-dependent HD superfamily phosphohydrolase